MIVRYGTSFSGLGTALPLPRYFGGPPRLSVSFLHDGPAGIRVGQSGTLTSTWRFNNLLTRPNREL